MSFCHFLQNLTKKKKKSKMTCFIYKKNSFYNLMNTKVLFIEINPSFPK